VPQRASVSILDRMTDLLGVYLEDHVAGAIAGVRVARRCARSNRGNRFGAALEPIVPELERHLDIAERVARAIGHPPSRLKNAAFAAGELAGRLKLNGRIIGYSPLSRVLELEGLVAGSRGRAGMWRALEDVARGGDPTLQGFDFAELASIAERQLEELEGLRREAARLAFGGR
jgi:hypothetical protein